MNVKVEEEESVYSICMHSQVTSVVFDSVTPWIVAGQFPLTMGISWQGYWSGFPCLPSGGHLDPGIEPASLKFPAMQANSLLWSHKRSLFILLT